MRLCTTRLASLLIVCLPFLSVSAVGEENLVTTAAADALTMLSTQMNANYQEIGTWSGTYDLTEKLYLSGRRTDDGATTGPVWQASEAVIEYIVDAKNARVRADFIKSEPATVLDRKTGEPIPISLAPREYQTVCTSEHLLHFATRDLRNQVKGYPKIDGFDRIRTRIVFRRPSQAADDDQFHVNPLTFFGDGDRRFGDTCILYARALKGELGEDSLNRATNNTTLLQRKVNGATEFTLGIRYLNEDGGVNHVRTIVFSSDVRYNPTSYKMASLGRPEVEMSWEYRREGGVVLPSRHEIRRYEWANPREDEPQDEDANLVSHRIFTLRESSLNKPVDAKAFDVLSLELEYGDRVADEIGRRLQVYDGEKLIAAEDFKLDMSRLPDRSQKVVSAMPVQKTVEREVEKRQRSRLPIAIVGVLLFVVAIVVFVRSRTQGAIR